MKVMLDTNVLVDLWQNTPDADNAFIAFDVALLRGFEVAITSLTAQTFVYLLSARKKMSKAEAVSVFGELMDTVSILDVTASDCRNAYVHFQGDFEDDLNAWSAHRSGVDVIVTRNLRDFRKSPVAAMSPQEFIDTFRPPDYEYDIVEL